MTFDQVIILKHELMLDTSEIIGQVKAKYDQPGLVTQVLGYPTVKERMLSIAQVPPNLYFEIDNKAGSKNGDESSLSFRLNNMEQAIGVIDKLFNLKGTSFGIFVPAVIVDKNIKTDDDIYLNFYLVKSDY